MSTIAEIVGWVTIVWTAALLAGAAVLAYVNHRRNRPDKDGPYRLTPVPSVTDRIDKSTGGRNEAIRRRAEAIAATTRDRNRPVTDLHELRLHMIAGALSTIEIRPADHEPEHMLPLASTILAIAAGDHDDDFERWSAVTGEDDA